ncbi:efflux RND transporter periplasmic adaptor subunit [Veillonella sp. R32]|uniref:efflux RND transporter periplasmic adaptor subunit n=1 Tax=Veillonella sp. R32 TaxID=2021312 RepID=UPI00138963A4|nr:efflux RND transporter periplasmic adaptor subunit [Veillonella sp. R32]KAF1679175.1 efflux transporter periplasmic adaptor subunit [Veillonella sp. R32]
MFKFRFSGALVAIMAMMLVVAGCGKEEAQPSEVAVNTYKIAATDTQIATSFNGTITSQNTTAIHARVSGHVVEKYVKGGQQVVKGQPLFRLDSRQYEANLASAQATAASTNASYLNSERDLQRYQQLANEDAIARQTLDTQASTAEQQRAALEANEAAVRIAQDNLQDTVIYAPFDGTLEMDDIDLGSYVTAGTTTLVTINTVDPVYVQFAMSETEYLEFMKNKQGQSLDNLPLQLRLSDGSIYQYTGTLVQAAKNLDSSSGQLIFKASFPNPEHMLLPNMYASVVSPGDIIKGAILVPTKALTQVLDKSFVYVVDESGTVKQVPVVTSGTQGIYTIVKSGVQAGETVVVDGLTKIRNGVKVKATALTKDQVEKTK